MLRVEKLRFGAGTPYETVFESTQQSGQRVMETEVARALRNALVGVVEDGTASRLAHVFARQDGSPIVVGGKTGSGDNRYETVGRGGDRMSSRAVSRTGTFAFYIGDRYFGVVTAYVAGPQAANYVFTSALPVTALKLLVSALSSTLDVDAANRAAHGFSRMRRASLSDSALQKSHHARRN